MKRFALFLFLIVLTVISARAATATGSVSYPGGGVAIAEKVFLEDSSSAGFSALDSAITNSSGVYTISHTLVYGRFYYIRCNTCGYPTRAWGYYSGSSLTINLTLGCGIYITDTVKNSVSGAAVYGQKVYITNGSGSYKDSAYTGTSGIVSFLVSRSVASGTFQVYTNACGLQSQSFSYSGSSVVAPTLRICLSNATISGTLTNLSTSSGIGYQTVYLADSSATALLYADSTTTSSSGTYSFLLPAYVPSGTVIVSAWTCGARARASASYSGSGTTLNLSGCATSSATVSGTLIDMGTGLAAAGRKVYFLDSTSGSSVYRDSALTNSSGIYSITIPPGITSGYFKLSTLSCGILQYGYPPLYSGRSIVMSNWSVSTGTPKTISGTVYSPDGAAAAGITVYIIGTGSSVSTSATGSYTLNIPCGTSAGTLQLGIGNFCTRTLNIAYTGSSLSGRVDTVCYQSISGTVAKGSTGGAASNAKVYLILKQTDTSYSPAITTLTATDSTFTNASGQYRFTFWASYNYYNSLYLVKAALQSTDPDYSNYLPTYYDTSLVWSGAGSVTYAQWAANTSSINITLRAGTNSGGPAFIGGDVLLGANKSTGVGDPLAGRILLLTTAAGRPVAYTYSDATGRFSFPNIAYGSYLVFGDAGGKLNPALSVTVAAGNDTVNNIVFEENSRKFEGHLGALSAAGPQLLDAVGITPNPARNYVAFSELAGIAGEKTIVIRGITGAVMGTGTIKDGAMGRINVSALPAGVYLLQLKTEYGIANFHLLKE